MKPHSPHLAYRLAVVLAAALTSLSCGNRLPPSLAMDPNPVFSGGIGWIVVSQAYARIKAAPSPDARDIGHMRGGDLLQVLSRERLPSQGSTWYKVVSGSLEGWLQGSQAAFFETRETAERAAVQYR